MKKTVVLSAVGILAAWSTTASADEVGRVISSTPAIQQVAVPRQVCSAQPVAVQQAPTGAGAVIGGIAGGVLGNNVGQGSGRAAATALGVIGGALLGNHVESSNANAQVQNMQQCSTQTFYENRTVGYNVVYEYAGRQYNVQMPNDPGPNIRLQVMPVGATLPDANPSAVPSGSGVISAPPMYQPVPAGQPIGQVVGVPVAAAYPAYAVAYPAYYPAYRPYYPPVGLSLSFGFFGGHHHGHWH